MSSVYAGRGSPRALARLWLVTLAGNLAGLLIMALLFAPHGVLPPKGLKAAGAISDTYTARAVLPALLSAIAAGALMTLFTWFAAAAESDVTRVFVALLAGFILVAPSLNHAVGASSAKSSSDSSPGPLRGPPGIWLETSPWQ